MKMCTYTKNANIRKCENDIKMILKLSQIDVKIILK